MSGDPLDFSDMFNTPLTPEEEAAYQTWAAANGRTRDTYDYDMRGAWKAGVQQAGNGHFPDTYKKPNHPTFSNESQYNGVEGMTGGRWVKDGQRWMFYASPTNQKLHGQDGLREYFKRVEPDIQLVFPAPGL